ncbi:MAG TPA: alpha/beta hydrolase [Candidatus Limnocylindria bacterium]
MRRIVLTALPIIVLAWALAPAARGVLLVQRTSSGPSAVATIAGLPTESVSFTASDGVALAGSYVAIPGPTGIFIVVHGFKTDRREMADYASMLVREGFSVLLYDSRGTGESGGVFGVGATEPRDIVGAVDFLRSSAEPGSAHIYVLGISLGAGDALLAAAQDDRIQGVIADSPWADERVQLARMSSFALGPLAIPVLPYEPALVDWLIDGRLEDARPRDVVARIGPRWIQLIHCADDDNATTSLADAQALLAAGGGTTDLWIVPSGGHAGAFRAHAFDYRNQIRAFLSVASR